ncbi:MAG: hypothetical protein MRERV_27c013 [Mycoplasmataceae bacterium RV_VA103A]|nr:MAG: hypothetical protein MRERV_27c013 [Mycoplasmataceae bacterium RV_VA103A]
MGRTSFGFFSQISEELAAENRRMENEEKIKEWKRKYYQLKPGEKYRGLTKEQIKRMLEKLGYWK